MNFTESFEQFSSRLGTMDLALYAGLGLIIWVLFKDRLSPVQKVVLGLVDTIKSYTKKTTSSVTTTSVSVTPEPVHTSDTVVEKEDLFFKLVVSWKQTRDLAVRSGCAEAVKVADQMFPFLSPMVCGKKDSNGVVTNE